MDTKSSSRLTPLWLVQNNLGNHDTHLVIQEACLRYGYDYQGYPVIPFSPMIPVRTRSSAGPVLAYGSTRFVKGIVDMKLYTPGAYFDEHIFTMSNCVRHWGSHMLNQDGTILPMAFARDLPLDPKEEVFYRPNGDLKEFAGEVSTFGEFCKWADVIAAGTDFEFDANLKIMISTPKKIDTEWRVFVTEDVGVISGSRYRVAGRLSVSPDVPPEVLKFVEDRIDDWMPVPAFALDVCEIAGELKIVELSDLHSAGHYAADVDAIIYEVSKTALRGMSSK